MSSQFATLCQETTLYNAWNIVKEKGAMGGIDGVTIQEFERDKRRLISRIVEELTNKTWKPYPYLEIEITKDKSQDEKRKIGMTAIRNKIVQLAIKGIIEPRYNRLFVGMTSRGVSILEKGKVIAQHHTDNLSHVVITGKGVSMSSNFVSYCMDRKIPIDFFDYHGKHIGSILTPKYIQANLWAKQSTAGRKLKNTISLGIIEGKLRNQHALLKYFNKYHKNLYIGLKPKMEAMEQAISDFKVWKRNSDVEDEKFVLKLMGHEAQVAIRYWDYIRELIADDDIAFERREHQGATDLTNSMLNYGYAILYTKIWQALLAARLNPFDSLIHVRQEGKPTLAYDLIEIFRSQVVDRMVISLIQKGRDLGVRNGLLTDNTRQLLVKSIMERLARYEKYQGEELKMENIILRQAKLLAKAFEGTEKFKPYVAKW